jgi:hypothetical protein
VYAQRPLSSVLRRHLADVHHLTRRHDLRGNLRRHRRKHLTFRRLFLVKAPARGRINLREGGYYIYTAPSSAGADNFTLRVCGSEDGKSGCATLEYAVTVN